jgi:putative intracellular protease/amidase
MAHILFPLPSLDFDPSEVAIPWQVLKARGHRVSFATADGQPAQADELMLSGCGLDPWGWVPGLRQLRLLGLVLRADGPARQAFAALQQDPAFQSPLRWAELRASDFDALHFCGGHRARGMRPYLESAVLQRLIANAFEADQPVSAICHGVLLVARSQRADGRSVLYGRKTTSLTWQQERTASALAHVGRFWDPLYYRTYPEAAGQPAGWMSVQQEVTRALASEADFLDVPRSSPHYLRQTLGLARDRPDDLRPSWVVRDGNYLSGRWPGDAHGLALGLAEVL